MGTSATRKAVTLNLEMENHAYIRELVNSGFYASGSEVVRDALRDHRREWIRDRATKAIRSLVEGITDDDLIKDKSLEDVLREALDAATRSNDK